MKFITLKYIQGIMEIKYGFEMQEWPLQGLKMETRPYKRDTFERRFTNWSNKAGQDNDKIFVISGHFISWTNIAFLRYLLDMPVGSLDRFLLYRKSSLIHWKWIQSICHNCHVLAALHWSDCLDQTSQETWLLSHNTQDVVIVALRTTSTTNACFAHLV